MNGIIKQIFEERETKKNKWENCNTETFFILKDPKRDIIKIIRNSVAKYYYNGQKK